MRPMGSMEYMDPMVYGPYRPYESYGSYVT